MDPIAVLSALPAELERLVATLQSPEPLSLAAGAAWRGQLAGRDVVLGQVGIGKVAAALVTTSLIERTQPRALLFTGVAGGLDPALAVGDVVIAERVVQHDAGTLTPQGLERYQAGHLPFFNPTAEFGWPCDPALVAQARVVVEGLRLAPLPDDAGGHGNAPRVVRGIVASGDVFVNDPDTRRRLHADLGARAVEMEGGAVAQVASTVGVPYLVVRALSDLAGHDSGLDFGRFVRHVSRSSAAVIERLVATM